jgi:hypothetical protein
MDTQPAAKTGLSPASETSFASSSAAKSCVRSEAGKAIPQVLAYTCGHYCDAATGVRIDWVPAGARMRTILTVCPECARKQPRPKRLKPYDWGDITGHSI